MRTKDWCVVLAITIILSSAPAVGSSGEEPELDLFGNKYSVQDLKKIVLTAEEWKPFPQLKDRNRWSQFSDKVRTGYILLAEKHLGCEWETPKASVFLEYVRNGNRSNFQRISYSRRAKLAELVLGECMEGKGRFLDDILNGIWTICEETYWGVPAHVGAQKRGPGLADVTEPTVDLFAAETGMLLAWTLYLVGEEMDRISPLVRERIEFEVKRRIIDVNLERDDFWWMGFGNRTVNNWNPWICSNWLTVVLLIERDPGLRARSIHKILLCLDNFLNPYPRDGGCDEGPGYWNRAGGSLFDCLELLQSASRGAIDVFDSPLIQEIGKYIFKAYIHNRYYINFADASAVLSPDASLIYRYGQSIKNRDMAGFGAFLARQQKLGEKPLRGSFGYFGRVLPALFQLEEVLSHESREPLLLESWFPELQVMAARTSPGSERGFYLAAKGGHNAESHNHNDVGNFILYADGYPVLIDVGVETYTAKTFSSKRYEIWTMQSAFHNLPTINGMMQKDGRQYRSRDVQYKSGNEETSFSLDIAGAYPEEAGIKTWRRSLMLDRRGQLTVLDSYELDEVRENLKMNLMTLRRPDIMEGGLIRLKEAEGIEGLREIFIFFDNDSFSAEIEEIPLSDSRLRSAWGSRVYRILLTGRQTPQKGRIRLTVRLEK